MGARLIATFAAAAIVCAAHAALCPQRNGVADATRAVSPASSLAAIDAASAHRAGFESRSSPRWPSSGTDAVLASVAAAPRVPEVGFRPAFVRVFDGANARILARGYDAAAPPALS